MKVPYVPQVHTILYFKMQVLYEKYEKGTIPVEY